MKPEIFSGISSYCFFVFRVRFSGLFNNVSTTVTAYIGSLLLLLLAHPTCYLLPDTALFREIQGTKETPEQQMEYEITGNLKLDRIANRAIFRCHKIVKVRDGEGTWPYKPPGRDICGSGDTLRSSITKLCIALNAGA
jgi:hypothetical protein